MPLMQEIKNGLVFVRTSPFLYWCPPPQRIIHTVAEALNCPSRAELFASRRNRSIHQIHDDVEGEHEDDNH